MATLARVRNNQRRCRARKQQYIAELEQRVRQLEESRDQDETRDLRRKLEKLEQENGRLRAIIDGLDLGRPWLGMQPNAQVVVAGKTPLSQTTLNEKLPDAGAVQPLPVKLWSETQVRGDMNLLRVVVKSDLAGTLLTVHSWLDLSRMITTEAFPRYSTLSSTAMRLMPA